jgi:hypothetical protein
MIIHINGQKIFGTPQEVAGLLNMVRKPETQTTTELSASVAQSQELRKKLEKDPNHNPFGGVLPGEQDTPKPASQPRRDYGAERDTGVSFDA